MNSGRPSSENVRAGEGSAKKRQGWIGSLMELARLRGK